MKPKPQTTRPQEGRNNRRTLLITGGKLGCRPRAISPGAARIHRQGCRRTRKWSRLEVNTFRLDGCSPELLASYLKALAVFRLVAEQSDPEVH